MNRISRRSIYAAILAAPVGMAGAAIAKTLGTEGNGVLSGNGARLSGKEMTERIIQVVALYHGITPDAMRSAIRSRSVVIPRQKAIYLAYRISGRSLPEIGRWFGGRDHTTVLHAVRKIEALAQEDPRLRIELEHLARHVDPSAVAILKRGEPRLARAMPEASPQR